MFNQHTYSYNARRNAHGVESWVCSMRKSRKCLANVRVKDNSVQEVRGTHTHEPPKYHITEAGKYIKLHWIMKWLNHRDMNYTEAPLRVNGRKPKNGSGDLRGPHPFSFIVSAGNSHCSTYKILGFENEICLRTRDACCAWLMLVPNRSSRGWPPIVKLALCRFY